MNTDNIDLEIAQHTAKNEWVSNNQRGYGYAFIDPDCGGMGFGWCEQWEDTYKELPPQTPLWVIYGRQVTGGAASIWMRVHD